MAANKNGSQELVYEKETAAHVIKELVLTCLVYFTFDEATSMVERRPDAYTRIEELETASGMSFTYTIVAYIVLSLHPFITASKRVTSIPQWKLIADAVKTFFRSSLRITT